MKVGTRQRREKDEHRIAQLRNEMATMEKTLNSEITKRIEMNKSLHQFCENEIQKMVDHFESLLETRKKAMTDKIRVLTNRIQALEGKFEIEMERIPRDIEERGEKLAKMLKDFEERFEAERADRLRREAALGKALADHEHAAALRFDRERTSRENTYVELRKALEENAATRGRGDAKFQELAALRNAVALERQTREREDDEIVEALNSYTAKLQTSLKIINSSET
ncbi:unnamed protein product [Heterosigma akashiwo]